ncbi:MAG TPA: hypothetical protein VFZ23_16220 [Pyrinomonadaceae bacterium]
MICRLLKITVFALLLVAANDVYAQSDIFPDDNARGPRSRRTDAPKGFKEMLAKQKAERDKKDHEQMLARGDEALRLANQLEASFSSGKTLSVEDKARLASLEEVVEKIRKELGGDDDGGEDRHFMKDEDEPKPSNAEEAFKYLQSTTVKLVDELKKTTRFTISALAIQSSNNVLKLVKFLRLRK